VLNRQEKPLDIRHTRLCHLAINLGIHQGKGNLKQNIPIFMGAQELQIENPFVKVLGKEKAKAEKGILGRFLFILCFVSTFNPEIRTKAIFSSIKLSCSLVKTFCKASRKLLTSPR